MRTRQLINVHLRQVHLVKGINKTPLLNEQNKPILSHIFVYLCISSNKSCKTVKPMISAVLSQTSGRNTWGTGHLILKLIRENTTANTLLIANGVLFLQEGLRSPIRLNILHSQIHVSPPASCCHPQFRLFRLRVHTLLFRPRSSDVSDFVFTPYVLRQRLGIKVIPPPDLCDTEDVQDEQHVLFHCANPHMISLRRKYASLFPPTGAHDVFPSLSQNNNKL